MALVLDLTDKLVRFPLAYSWQPVRGWPIKHFDTTLASNSQRTKQHALGEGPWDACEKLWADAFEIPSTDFVFHPGLGDDAPDANFPSDASHPWTAYVSAKCKPGLSEAQTDALFGIYRTLRTGNYNGSGQQLNSSGAIVTPSDPRTEYFFKPNPANVAVDQIIRWGQRQNTIINWPAWVDWRDYNDELIGWDDAAYTPRSLSLTPTSGGSLTPGQTYFVRVSTMKSGDESSASIKTLETKANSITLAGGQTAFQVNWLIKGDDQNPVTNPSGITGYRVYIGTVSGVWLGFFNVSNPAARNFLVTTIAGPTAGSPRDQATSGLLKQIKRFECGLFLMPPYDLTSALDRICQISCSDWQWSGLGTNTFRNDKIRFMSPANRAPVFTLNLAETGIGTFKTYPVDRRNRPNQIIVNFRDRDDEFLGEGQPVILDREQLQEDDRQVKPFTIEGGTMYRSQAQRIASFYARVLCDMDQMAELEASPKSYHVLPGDSVFVTNDMPDWSDVKFIVRRKGENIEGKIGDSITAQLYTDDLYSDTDHSPLPRPLPAARINPFAAPPVASNLVLTEINILSPDLSFNTGFQGTFDFGNFPGAQIARVLVKGPAAAEPPDSAYNELQVLIPDQNNKGSFQFRGLAGGHYWVKIITESSLGSQAASGHPIGEITLSTPLQTDLKVIDGVPPRDNYYDALGLTIAAGQVAGVGSWLGTRVFKDRGFGYEWAADITRQSSIGVTVAPFLSALGDQIDIQIGAGTPAPSNATLAEVNAGKNNWMVGREVLGVRTWTSLGAGVYRGTNLVRGLRLTDHLQGTHTATEDAIMLDDSVSFIPMEARDLDMNISLKALTYGLTALGAVTAVTILFAGCSVIPHPPRQFSCAYDLSNGNGLIDWSEGEDRIGVESYELEFRDGPGSGAATIRGPIPVTPSELSRTSNTPPLIPLAGGGLLPLASYTMVAPGGFDAVYTDEQWNTFGLATVVHSQSTFPIKGGFTLEAQVSEFESINGLFPSFFGIVKEDIEGGSPIPIGWTKAGSINPDVIIPSGAPIDRIYHMIPGDRFTIQAQPDGTVVYYINYIGAMSDPWYVSPDRLNMNLQYRLQFTNAPYPTGISASTYTIRVRNVRWLRNIPEFVYTGDMQKLDYETGEDLPDTIWGRVRQKSFLPRGKPSDWTYGEFIRP